MKYRNDCGHAISVSRLGLRDIAPGDVFEAPAGTKFPSGIKKAAADKKAADKT